QVLAGLDWVASHARAIQVVNLALAVERPTAPAYGADPLTVAVEHVRSAGVVVVAAAGNKAGEVRDPGLDPQALTVGAADLSAEASGLRDKRAGAGLVTMTHSVIPKATPARTGEGGFNRATWNADAWTGLPGWQSQLDTMWSGPAWTAVTWSAVTWSAVTWSSS